MGQERSLTRDLKRHAPLAKGLTALLPPGRKEFERGVGQLRVLLKRDAGVYVCILWADVCARLCPCVHEAPYADE